MKIILIPENPGGDDFIHVVDAEDIICEDNIPSMGFHIRKISDKILTISQISKYYEQNLSRRYNVMRHLSQLFRSKKRDKKVDPR